MAKIINFISKNESDTKSFAISLKEKLYPFKLIALYGEMGSGKTTFVKGLLSSFQINETNVSSPTFSYLHSFQAHDLLIHHFDLYRLKDEDQFLALGFDEYLFEDNICIIEWPEIVKSFLSKIPMICIHFEHMDLYTRKIQVQYA